jgi:hypothetical protein
VFTITDTRPRAALDKVKLTHFMVAVAKAIVESQVELDAMSHQSLDDFDENGIAPVFRVWRVCRFKVPVVFNGQPKNSSDEPTYLSLEPATKPIAYLQFSIHHRPHSK